MRRAAIRQESQTVQTQNQMFEDLSRLLSSIAGTMAGAGREAEARMKERLREAVGGVDFVSREEFEAVKAMAAETRAELEELKAAVAGGAPAGAAKGASTKAGARKIDIS